MGVLRSLLFTAVMLASLLFVAPGLASAQTTTTTPDTATTVPDTTTTVPDTTTTTVADTTTTTVAPPLDVELSGDQSALLFVALGMVCLCSGIYLVNTMWGRQS